MKLTKQVVGIDIASDKFDVIFGHITNDQHTRYTKSRQFANQLAGFEKLTEWISQYHSDPSVPLWIVMEATGVYYQQLAYYLKDNGFNVEVVLPNKISNYAKSLEIKSKTDRIDARTICRFGLERRLNGWNPPKRLFQQIKSLCRHRQTLIDQRSQNKCQLHAVQASYQPNQLIVQTLNDQIEFLNQKIDLFEQQISQLVGSDDQLNRKINQIATIKGISPLTVTAIVAETDGFALIRNQKQLTSYAGMDVVFHQSGKYQGKTKISKKGNSHIRRALYMPAMSACRCNEQLKGFYNRVNQNKPAKTVGIMAVARKLLLLIYTLWKNDTTFDPNYTRFSTVIT